MQNAGIIVNNKFNDNDMFNDCSRTYDNKFDSISNTNRMEKSDSIIDENRLIDLNINIYRFKLSQEIEQELYTFSKVHQYDHRKVFKEAWELWIEENNVLVSNEVERLRYLGYNGNIIDKMFKSARYYYRKKSIEKKDAAKRRIYVNVQKELIESMDNHIKNGLISNDFKPSDGFNDFCKINFDLLKEQVIYLCKNGLNNSEEIKNKIKKTYKNRYFLIIKKYL